MSMYLIVQNDNQVLQELAIMNIQRKGFRSVLHAWPARSRTNYLVQVSWPEYTELLAKPWYAAKVIYASVDSDIVIDAWREALSPQFMAGQNPTVEQRDQHWQGLI